MGPEKKVAARRVVALARAVTVAKFVRMLAFLKLNLSAEEIKTVLAHYIEGTETGTKVSRSLRVPGCHDEDDRMFLLAYAARAEALVTGNRDLLALASDSGIRIELAEAFKR